MELKQQEEVLESLKGVPRPQVSQEVLSVLAINARLVRLAEIAKAELTTLAARFEVVQMHKFGRAVVRRNFITMHPEYLSTIPDKLPFMDEELEAVFKAIIEANDRLMIYHPFVKSARTGRHTFYQ